tara:strand:- start:2376 stop:2831 length:456 start_codon:yes stop_codon:yes gene_type:complete
VSALLSSCRTYRYRLDRNVDLLGDKVVAYFGVNPSTADEDIDDATVRKWRGFSQRLQANRFIVGNVFAYRATDVSQLASVEDAVGPDNPMHLKSIIAEADILIPCWGSRNKLPQILWPHLDNLLFVLLHSGKPVYCFGKTASQDPKHPFIG